eukprot:1958305-Rhodomonas_salina.1
MSTTRKYGGTGQSPICYAYLIATLVLTRQYLLCTFDSSAATDMEVPAMRLGLSLVKSLVEAHGGYAPTRIFIPTLVLKLLYRLRVNASTDARV